MKPVLIIENSSDGLKINETPDKKYVMEGIFTEFGVLNRNERIYTANEFVPYVTEMMEKQKWGGAVYGEFDHPDVFDISMKYVSHLIEKCEYNQEANRVDGEIRLLNTQWGKEAKALVDDGCPIFVSSRAAGVTESDGHVKLKKLFTYDIVADPGFSSAKMNIKSLNESFGYSTESNFRILSVPEGKMSNIFDLSDESKTNELFNMNRNDLVTKTQLADYSKYLTVEISKIKSDITSQVTESVSKGTMNSDVKKMAEYYERLQEQQNQVIKYLDYLAEKVSMTITKSDKLEEKTEKIVEYTNYIAENLDKSIDYSNYIAENLDKSIDYSNYIAENLDKSIDYSNYIAENLDKSIDYSNYIAENLDKSIDYSNYIAENLDKSIDYSNYIAENLDKSIDYSNYIAENLDKSIAYGEYLAENIDDSIQFSNYIAENLDNTIAYSNYIAENLDANIGYTEYLVENLDANIAYTEYIAENVDSAINYSEYVAECADKTMSYANMISEKLNKGANGFGGKLITESIEDAQSFLSSNEFDEDAELAELEAAAEKEADEAYIEEEEEFCAEGDEDCDDDIILPEFKNESITSKIDLLIAEAKKREASKDTKPAFYAFLNPQDVETFETLTQDEQEKAIVAVKESVGYYSRQDVLTIVKQAIETEKPSNDEVLVNAIPSDIKPVWESLDTKSKKSILAQSRYYDLSSNELLEHFWSTRKFPQPKLNESKNLIEQDSTNFLNERLSDEQIEYFTNKFKGMI
jgi:hypothetical protein